MSSVEMMDSGRIESARLQVRPELMGQAASQCEPDPSPEELRQQVRELERQNDALKQQVRELSAYMRLAYHDALTGLRNRRYIEKRLSEEINRVSRDPGQPFSLLMIDIDDFKRINDTHGHAVGDETLCWVGEFLEGSVREHDVVCRFAGDEFVVLLPDSDRPAAVLLEQRLRDRLAAVRSWSGVEIGLSIGEATFGLDGSTARELLGSADERMYRDKRSHKLALRRCQTAEFPVDCPQADGESGSIGEPRH